MLITSLATSLQVNCTSSALMTSPVGDGFLKLLEEQNGEDYEDVADQSDDDKRDHDNTKRDLRFLLDLTNLFLWKLFKFI